MFYLVLCFHLAYAKPKPLKEPEETLQVAWMSPLGQKARAGQSIEVVDFRDLRNWVRSQKPSAKRILQYLGLLPLTRNRIWWFFHRRFEAKNYKIVIFDVDRKHLCRPIYNSGQKTERQGVSICTDKSIGPINRLARDGFSGKGYALDTESPERSLEVYRITWRDAVTKGFCVFPLGRFLSGV